MKYWLIKSEPNVWSINQQKKAGTKGAPWDGVRNYQAANNLKKMYRNAGGVELGAVPPPSFAGFSRRPGPPSSATSVKHTVYRRFGDPLAPVLGGAIWRARKSSAASAAHRALSCHHILTTSRLRPGYNAHHAKYKCIVSTEHTNPHSESRRWP